MLNFFHDLTVAQAIVIAAAMVCFAWVITTSMQYEDDDSDTTDPYKRS